MTDEIRETKMRDLADLDDMIEEMKMLLKLKKKRRKELRKELDYTVEEFYPSKVDIKEVVNQP